MASLPDLPDKAGPLREVLLAAAAESGLSMNDLTVLANQNDPYRIDTEAGHRDGQWFAAQVEALNRTGRPLHLRGFHYAILSREAVKPNGQPYTNTDKDWGWLQEKAADAARWLGYVPFEQIIDQRNAQPTIRTAATLYPRPMVYAGEVELLLPDELHPTVGARDFDRVQPYKLVLIGEKASLGPVLSPICAEYHADLYLPTGEPSDTMLHTLARSAAEDGRPTRVFYFSDCDPSGWQMPISAARKLQALIDLEFSGIDLEVHRVALTPDHVRTHGLPSTPLKSGESRAGAWFAATGIEQTEIDALAELQPRLLRGMARDALAPFVDNTLPRRVRDAREAWERDAQSVLDAALDPERLAIIRTGAEARIAELSDEVAAINAALAIDVDGIDLPEMVIPEAEVAGHNGHLPLFSSAWGYGQASRRLIDSKAYRLDPPAEGV